METNMDMLTSKGLVRQWALVDGEPRCTLDALDPFHPDAASAYGRALYIEGLLARDNEQGDEPDDDVALLRRVRERDEDTYEDDLAALEALIASADPVMPPANPPESISDRQFAHGLARMGVISNDEALAFVRTGALPEALEAFMAALPDAQDRFDAEMLLSGAIEFRLDHPLVGATASALGWSPEQVRAFWAMAGRL
jgi:hypothetical protein